MLGLDNMGIPLGPPPDYFQLEGASGFLVDSPGVLPSGALEVWGNPRKQTAGRIGDFMRLSGGPVFEKRIWTQAPHRGRILVFRRPVHFFRRGN